jgi:intracellular sulfur oxidation DsrE/DsrF family protein
MSKTQNVLVPEPEEMPWLKDSEDKNSGVIYLISKGIGNDKVEGQNILIEFLNSLILSPIKPEYIIFAGKSVELFNENNNINKILFEFEEYKTEIIICKESLKNFIQEYKIKKTKILEMQDIVEILMKNNKVLTI